MIWPTRPGSPSEVDHVRARRVVSGQPTWPSSSESSTARSFVLVPPAVEGTRPDAVRPAIAEQIHCHYTAGRQQRSKPIINTRVVRESMQCYQGRLCPREIPHVKKATGRGHHSRLRCRRRLNCLGHEGLRHRQPAARTAGRGESAPWRFMWPSSRRKPKRGVILTRNDVTNLHLRL